MKVEGLPMRKWGSKMVVDWKMVNGSYVFGDHIVEVITNKMVERTAKVSGNKRKERRLEVRLNGFEDVYECGTESFKKGSFLKNLVKKSTHKAIKYLLPAKLEDISLVNFWGHFDQEYFDMIDNEFGEAFTLKEIKAVYKKYAKRLHPDTSRASNNTFELLKATYEFFKAQRIMIVDNCRKAGIDMEY